LSAVAPVATNPEQVFNVWTRWQANNRSTISQGHSKTTG
jgi:hypothetical protein